MTAGGGSIRGGVAHVIAAMALLAILAASWALPRSASAESAVGSAGSGAGQLLEPGSVAVDRDDDLLYVADTGNDRISVFDASTGAFVKAFGWGVADGTTNALQVCTATCFKGVGGTGSGQLDNVVGVAVDNDSTSPGYHDVYIFETSSTNVRVQKFTPAGSFVWTVGGKVNKTTEANLCTAASGNTCGAGLTGDGEGFFNRPAFGSVVAVGPGGTVYVADQLVGASPQPSRVQKFSPSGAPLGQLVLPVAGGAEPATGIAVDAGGNLYVGTAGATGAARKYSPTGTELWSVDPSFNVTALAVDTDGNLFVADNTPFPSPPEQISTILQYDPTGVQTRAFYGSLEARVTGLVPYPNPPFPNANGDIFAAEQAIAEKNGRVVDVDYPPTGPVVLPKPSSTLASPIGNTKATVNSKVNPEGEATTYHFEYISDEDFKAAGDSFGPGTVETPESGSIGADFALHLASAPLSGLFPETTYHFRAVATNASGEDVGPTSSFETKEPVEFGDLWSTDVLADSAELHAEANPLGIASTARFEYVEQAQFEASGFANTEQVPAPPADPFDLGDGEAMEEVSAAISGLQEGTSYRYRLVVTNRCKPEPAPLCDFAEVEGTFTTFATLNPIAGCPNDPLRSEGSGEFLPDCRAYEMVSAAEKNGGNVEPLANVSGYAANLDQAALDGEAISYSSYKAFADPASSPYTSQYLARRDADAGWQSEAISPLREGPSLMTHLSSQLDRQYQAFSADLCSGWVVQDANPTLAPGAIEAYPGLYRRSNCAGAGDYEALTTLEPPATVPPNLPPKKFIPEMQGTSADGSVAVFTVNDNLTADASAQPPACAAEAGTSEEKCLSRLYEVGESGLRFVCVLPDGSPYAGTCAAGTPEPKKPGRFANVQNAVSDDGSRIFWSAVVDGSGVPGGPAPLYVRIDATETVEVSAAPARFWAASADGSRAIISRGGQLFEFDVEDEQETLIAAGFLGTTGFAGASEDATRVYFASTQVLTGEEENSEGAKAQAGKPNLYLYEAGAGFDFIATLADGDLHGVISATSSPVSNLPVGRLSRISPNGGQLAFMSLAPITGYDNEDAVTGEPNMEVFLYDATADGGAGTIACASCNPSGARSEGRLLTQKGAETRRAAARIPAFESQLYGQRVISADGQRLYFNSFEALSSRDQNGEEDVYQWQAPGSGSCIAAAPTFSEASGGCVDLISTGQSPQGSELVDISADGRDVFFKTYESLVNQDPNRFDIYDARIGGGFPGLPAPPVICQGEACQQPPSTAPAASSPATGAAGPGNPAWPQSKPRARKCPKGKHRVKTRGKVRCANTRNAKGKKRQSGQRGRTGR